MAVFCLLGAGLLTGVPVADAKKDQGGSKGSAAPAAGLGKKSQGGAGHGGKSQKKQGKGRAGGKGGGSTTSGATSDGGATAKVKGGGKHGAKHDAQRSSGRKVKGGRGQKGGKGSGGGKLPQAQPAANAPTPSPVSARPSTPTSSGGVVSPQNSGLAGAAGGRSGGARQRSVRRTPRLGADGPSTSAPSGGGVRGRSVSSASSLAPAVGGRAFAPAKPVPAPAPTKPKAKSRGSDDPGAQVARTVKRFVEVVPQSLKMLIGALGALTVMLGVGYLFWLVRARSLRRQRSELLQEVGLLQTALLPPVPDKLGAVRTSVAYRPADGPGAGGDFYDALPLPGGRAGFILGDVSGHGRQALARTAFMRYTLRAYLEAGLEPRVALQVAGRVIDDNLDTDFATVIVAIHDPATGSLTYASAGHPAPIVTGATFAPVLAASSPPIGVGLRTGLRQTTIPLGPGSVACLYTDGLTEARTEDGILGRGRLSDVLEDLGRDATAPRLLDRVADEARIVSDDMACCLIAPAEEVTTGGFRTEQLELSALDLDSGIAERFLAGCAVAPEDIEAAEAEARDQAERFGGAVLHVSFGNRQPRVDVLPRNVESIEAASRRVAVH